MFHFPFLFVKGPLPDPKKPRAMHGTLIMKENVSFQSLETHSFIGNALMRIQIKGFKKGIKMKQVYK